MPPGLEANMPERGGHIQRALAGEDGAVHITRHPAMDTHGGIDRPEPQRVAECLGKGLGAAQMVQPPPEGFSQSSERAV